MTLAARSIAFFGWAGRYVWSAWAGAAGLFCLAAAWQAGHEFYGSFILPSPLETLSALSDLILLVWDGRNAGAANGRPLQCPEPGVWRMTNAYLNPDAPKEKTGTAP